MFTAILASLLIQSGLKEVPLKEDVYEIQADSLGNLYVIDFFFEKEKPFNRIYVMKPGGQPRVVSKRPYNGIRFLGLEQDNRPIFGERIAKPESRPFKFLPCTNEEATYYFGKYKAQVDPKTLTISLGNIQYFKVNTPYAFNITGEKSGRFAFLKLNNTPVELVIADCATKSLSFIELTGRNWQKAVSRMPYKQIQFFPKQKGKNDRILIHCTFDAKWIEELNIPTVGPSPGEFYTAICIADLKTAEIRPIIALNRSIGSQGGDGMNVRNQSAVIDSKTIAFVWRSKLYTYQLKD